MAIKFVLSPTEHDLAKALGSDAATSSVPESKGADILIYSEVGLMGVQRKAVPNDFISSFTDGRFAKALPLLRDKCTFQRILLEGRFKYYPDQTVDLGRFKNRSRIPSHFTKSQIKGMISDLEFMYDMKVDYTEDIKDTVLYLRTMAHYLNRKTHMGLFKRPNVKGLWAVPTSREIELWVLQSFPGIGPTTADKIIQFFSGTIPIRWTCSLEELCMVPGISKDKAKELFSILPTEAPILDKTLIKSNKKPKLDNTLVSTFHFDELRAKLKGNHA